MFAPKSEWIPPLELPDLSDAKKIAIDVETRDPNMKSNGPGWPTKDGEVVPGVEHRPAGDPKSFSITFEKGTGRQQIAAAWSDGAFGGLLPGIAPATLASLGPL
jgi:hypothetical protein